MPLILLCGYPCSGKSTVASLLAGCLQTQRPDCQIEVVSEESIAGVQPVAAAATATIDPRVAIYTDANLEKQFRAEIKSKASGNPHLTHFSPLPSHTERALTGKKPSNTVVIVDANNYIKGYRYELYCTAKSMRHQQAILHCTTGLDRCREINAKAYSPTQHLYFYLELPNLPEAEKAVLGRYPEAVFSELVTRFERPNPSSRWDNPLYELCLPEDLEQEEGSSQELRTLVDQLTARILGELLSSGTKVRPNQSTVPAQSAGSNYLQVIPSAL
ncbi:unnamed protein product [Dibothriocephalus latus]|uniref:Protein KTI12 homolog n=1 Tax=Dibothriocephalus latus TaxID=60516 RepID=A0A3P7LE90_DIBLA|nr:unnamed protein product [Dibothriocephalus latus]